MKKDDLVNQMIDARPELKDDDLDVYNLMRRVENLAADTEFSAHQMAAIEDEILGAVALEEKPALSWVHALQRIFIPAAAAACALLLFIALPKEDGWQARGDAGLRAGVNAQCVSQSGALGAQTSVGAQLMHGQLTCARKDLVAFTANNLSSKDLHLMIVALSHDVDFVTDQSVRVPAGSAQVVLEDAARAKDTELFVLFFDAPTSRHTIEAQLADAQARGHLRSAAKLPVPAVVQARVKIEVR